MGASNGTFAQDDRRQSVLDASPELNKVVRQAIRAEEAAQSALAQHNEHIEENPWEAGFNNEQVASCATFALLLSFLYLIDVYLQGPIAAFFVRHFVSSKTWAWVLTVAMRLTLPTIIIGFELWAADSIYRYGQRELYRPLYRILWVIGGLLVAFGAVAGVLVLDRAASLVEQEGEARMLRQVVFYLLALVSFVGHIFLLFSGARGHAAKAYFFYRFRLRRKARIDRRTVSAYDVLHAQVTVLLTRYIDLIQNYNRDFPDRALTFGPFDREVLPYLRRKFPTLGIPRLPPEDPPDGGSAVVVK